MAAPQARTIPTSDGLELYAEYSVPNQPSTALTVLVHGYGDHLGRYAHVVSRLNEQGIAVFAYDSRGHGRSPGRRGHVERWLQYVDDLDAAVTIAKSLAGGKPVSIFAHSHGCLVTLHWVAKAAEPVRALMLSSPYLRLAFRPPTLKVLAARAAGMLVPWLPVATGITPSQLSRDAAWNEATFADPLYVRTATPGWFTQTAAAQHALAGLGSHIRLPTLMMTGGGDTIASTPTSHAFFESLAAKDKKYVEYTGAHHEIFADREKEAMIDEIYRWISQHC